jgi:hypothetical protein
VVLFFVFEIVGGQVDLETRLSALTAQ